MQTHKDLAFGFALPKPLGGVCAAYGEISPSLLLECWVLLEVPVPMVLQQEPLLGPGLCGRTNLLLLGLRVLFQQLPFGANVMFFL